MAIKKTTRINLYKFVDTKMESSSAGGETTAIAKSINVQTQAINSMGSTINGIASVLVDIKKIELHKLKMEEDAKRRSFKPKFDKVKPNAFKKLFQAVKAYKVKGFLESILSFLGSLLKFLIIKPALEWLGDPKNKDKIKKSLETLDKVFKWLTKFLGGQIVATVNDLAALLSEDTDGWTKVKKFTKLWLKFSAAMIGIRFLRNPVKLLRQVKTVGRLLMEKTRFAKFQLNKRKKFLTRTGGRAGKFFLGGFIGGAAIAAFMNWLVNRNKDDQSGTDGEGDSSSTNEDGDIGNSREKDRARSKRDFDQDLTSAIYGALGLETPKAKKEREKKEKQWWNPRNWFGGKKQEQDKKKSEKLPNFLGVLLNIQGANEQAKDLVKTFNKETNELKSNWADADGTEKARIGLGLFNQIKGFLGVESEKIDAITSRADDVLQGTQKAVESGDTNILKTFQELIGREQGGIVKMANGGRSGYIDGPDTGYPVSLDGKKVNFIGHGLEKYDMKGSSAFVTPIDNFATRQDPTLTNRKAIEGKKLGFHTDTFLPKASQGGGFNLFNPMSWFSRGGRESKADQFFRGAYGDRNVQIQGSGLAAQVGRNRQNLNAIMQDLGYSKGGMLRMMEGGGLMTGFDWKKGSAWKPKGEGKQKHGRPYGFPQAYREPQSGGLGILQRMILASGSDDLTMALLARTVMNRKAVLDGGGTGFKAKSSSLYDILMAPGEYPNIQNNKFAQNYTSADLNKAGQAIGLAKNSKLLRERLQEQGIDPHTAMQIVTATTYKQGSLIGKKQLGDMFGKKSQAQYGRYQFSGSNNPLLSKIMPGMNLQKMKGLQGIVGGLMGKDGKDSTAGQLLKAIAGGGDGETPGMMDTLFGMFGMPTKKGGSGGGGKTAGPIGAAFKALMGGKKKPSRKEKDAEQQRMFRERQKQQMIQQGVNQKNAAARETMARAQELTNTTIQAVSKSNEKVMQGISIANQAVQRSAATSQGGGGGSSGGLMGFLKKTGAALLASQKGKS